MRRHMRGGAKLWVFFIVLAVAAIAAAGVLWQELNRFADAPMAIHPDAPSVVIPHGAGFNRIVDELQARKLSAAPHWFWRLQAERMHVTRDLHAGEYALRPGMTPRQLLDDMAHARVVQHRFTIVDGWSFKELREALDKAPVLKHETAAMTDAQIMQRVGAGDEKAEGRFLPETYAFVRGDSDLDILKRSYRAMNVLLKKAWANRADDLPLKTPYQALILASIVEKETGRADERPRIAGVFVRRLRRGMLLQTDPTVIYGMGAAYHGNIRKRDLETDTPYNTYVHPGLPPTPIALPGKPAIEAALHPAAGKSLYFVAKGDGSHVFSDTLAQHDRAVRCYQLKRCSGGKR
ncbi:endolytic transglycosylase MltG [Oleiagrimonas citrea]|uniref:Endolytic murein transglycosylase n=1 Tax=Oleiagrimonas citrea TaxID=1665687 RepID=A0A846ZHY7_9GAMM|nr:endolytic transglycosylase MltG [Oleiagrimonas citrea]NKZ37756.1 endolytic transglycosylase MltG [Oleiagrimonas citrea]